MFNELVKNSKWTTSKAEIIKLILEGRRQKKTWACSQPNLKVGKPKIKVERVKGHSKALAAYSAEDRTTYLSNADLHTNPYVIHEFYHHVRVMFGKYRRTENHANRFAKEFLL